MFAAPTQSGLARQCHFHDWRAIGEHPALKFGHFGAYLVSQFSQAIAHHLMVIAPQGVTRNEGALAILQDLPTVFGLLGQVIHAQGNHAQCARHQLRRAGAFYAVFCHIIQLAVQTRCQPLQQAGFGLGQIGVTDPHRLETQFGRPQPYLLVERDVICLLRMFDLHSFDLHGADDSGITLQLADENATLACARRLAAALQPGMVIYLYGDLGAGKTTLVRGILNALGYTGRVKSPTYTLLESYTIKNLELRHFDLYRMNSPEEWEGAGFDDEVNGENILLIEWPEQALGFVPDADIEVRLDILAEGREVKIDANSLLGKQCLRRY
jgi:tRNA threonylcarbamoyladenosine biosynthesis protein TsaE